MKKKEIAKYVEDQIDYHCDEFGLEREEVLTVVLLNCFEYFRKGKLSKEDLFACSNYLNLELCLDEME